MNKFGKRAVVSPLNIRRKSTSRKLVRLQVIGQAFTAPTFSGAGLVGAGALGIVDLNLAFHW